MPVVAYATQPYIDFRPYKSGNNLWTLMQVPPGAPVDSFVSQIYYEKGGQVKEFPLNALPDESTGWKYKDTKTVKVREGYVPPIHDFTITTAAGDDYTEDFLTAPATLFVVSQHMEKARIAAFTQLAPTVEWAKQHQVRVACLTASTPKEVAQFQAEHPLPFDVYYTDQTVLKTMDRSNPGVMLLKKGLVLRHWNPRNVPSAEEVAELLK